MLVEEVGRGDGALAGARGIFFSGVTFRAGGVAPIRWAGVVGLFLPLAIHLLWTFATSIRFFPPCAMCFGRRWAWTWRWGRRG